MSWMDPAWYDVSPTPAQPPPPPSHILTSTYAHMYIPHHMYTHLRTRAHNHTHTHALGHACTPAHTPASVKNLIQVGRAHGVQVTGHVSFGEHTEAVTVWVCLDCGKKAKTDAEKALHTRHTGHSNWSEPRVCLCLTGTELFGRAAHRTMAGSQSHSLTGTENGSQA